MCLITIFFFFYQELEEIISLLYNFTREAKSYSQKYFAQSKEQA